MRIYAERLKSEMKSRAWSYETFAERVTKALQPGEDRRGTSVSGLRSYMSEGAPPHPRPTVMRAAASVLGVPYEWLMGEVDDPTDASPAVTGLQTRSQLKTLQDAESKAVRRGFPEYTRLSLFAKEAARDLTRAIRSHQVRSAAPEATKLEGTWLKDSVAAGKALNASLKVLGVAPARIPNPELNDFVVLSCQGLKVALRKQLAEDTEAPKED